MFIALKALHLLALLLGGGASVGGGILMAQVKASGQPPTPVVASTSAALGRVGLSAIVLLWLTGIPLMVMTDAMATGGVAFMVKLVLATLVLGLILWMTAIRANASKAHVPPPAKKLGQIAIVVRLSTIAAIILAVVAFG